MKFTHFDVLRKLIKVRVKCLHDTLAHGIPVWYIRVLQLIPKSLNELPKERTFDHGDRLFAAEN